MRLIEEQMLDAIAKQVTHWKSGNTRVNTIGEGESKRINVFLHDNLIAKFELGDPDKAKVAFWHCGYPTKTTTSRLHAIAYRYCNVRVFLSHAEVGFITRNKNHSDISEVVYWLSDSRSAKIEFPLWKRSDDCFPEKMTPLNY